MLHIPNRSLGRILFLAATAIATPIGSARGDGLPCDRVGSLAPGDSAQLASLFESVCETQFKADTCTDYLAQQTQGIQDPEKRVEWIKKFRGCRRASTKGQDSDLDFEPKACLAGIGNSLVDMVTGIPMMVYEATRKGPDCGADLADKKKRLETFNHFVESSDRLTPDETALAKLSCDDFKKMLWDQSHKIRDRRKAQIRQAGRRSIFDAPSESPTSPDSAPPGIWTLVKMGMQDLKLRDECYSSEARNEMRCELGTAVAAAALGGVSSASKLAALARLSEKTGKSAAELEALAQKLAKMTPEQRIARATARGPLTDSERILKANEALGRRLSADEQTGLLRAHLIGEAEGAGYGTYTPEQIRAKAKVLRRFGFSPIERRILLPEGFAGSASEVGNQAAHLEVQAAKAGSKFGLSRGVSTDPATQAKWLDAAHAREATLKNLAPRSATEQRSLRDLIRQSEEFILEPNKPFRRPDQQAAFDRLERSLGREQTLYEQAAESFIRAGRREDALRILRASPYVENFYSDAGRDYYIQNVMRELEINRVN